MMRPEAAKDETQRGGWWPLVITAPIVTLPPTVFVVYLFVAMLAKAGLD